MIVKCGVNGESLEDRDILVCHHCGIPLCRTHGRTITPDHAFADADAMSDYRPAPNAAAPTPQPPHPRPTTTRPTMGSASSVPSAIHCPKCAKDFHWAETSRARIESRLRTFGSARSADGS
jgi:hypothetical protein